MSAHKLQFCRSADGTTIAFSVIGRGPPLLIVSGWGHHLERDLKCPVASPLILELSKSFSVIRFDARGFGLSQRDVMDHGVAAQVHDARAVIAATGFAAVSVLSIICGTPASITLTADHPELVAKLVVHCGMAQGMLVRDSSPEMRRVAEALLEQVAAGWDLDDPMVRDTFAKELAPDFSDEDRAAYSEKCRIAITRQDAERRLGINYTCDITSAAPRISRPAILLHSERCYSPPYDQGMQLASLIPGSRFVTLDTATNYLRPGTRAWTTWMDEVRGFLGEGDRMPLSLSNREAEVASLMAQGLDNAQISARLEISEKTTRNHVTRVFAKLGVESRAQAIVLLLKC